MNEPSVGKNALISAIYDNNIESFRFCVEAFPDDLSNNVLSHIVSQSLKEFAEVMFAAGFVIDTREKIDRPSTILGEAAQAGDQEFVELLLDNGVPINDSRDERCVALCDAVLEEDAPMVELLIKRGGQVNSNFKSGVSLLKLANDEIREILLANGATPQADFAPKTVYDLPPKSEFSFTTAENVLTAAIGHVVHEVETNFPGESICAFVVYDDSEGISPMPALELASRWANNWRPGDWTLEARYSEGFVQYADVLRELNSRSPNSGIELHSFATTIKTLKELQHRGYFGTPQPVVFFSLADDDRTVWLEHTSAKLINPPDVFARFESEWLKSSWGQQLASYQTGRFEEQLLKLID